MKIRTMTRRTPSKSSFAREAAIERPQKHREELGQNKSDELSALVAFLRKLGKGN